MKNLITCTACVMLLMTFVIQFVYSQERYMQLIAVANVIETFEEIIAEDGIAKADAKWVCEKISQIVECDENEVNISCASSKKTGKTIFSYHISFPIKGIIASPAFWGIEEDENRVEQSISGEIRVKERRDK